MKKNYLTVLLVVFLIGCSESKQLDCTNIESISRIENNYKDEFSNFYFQGIPKGMEELEILEERISKIDDITNENQRRSEKVYTSSSLENIKEYVVNSAHILNLFNKGSIAFKIESIREETRSNNKIQCKANLNIYLDQKHVAGKPIKYELEKLLDSSDYYMNSTAPSLKDVQGFSQIMRNEINLDDPIDVELIVLEYLKQKEQKI